MDIASSKARDSRENRLRQLEKRTIDAQLCLCRTARFQHAAFLPGLSINTYQRMRPPSVAKEIEAEVREPRNYMFM